MLKHTGLALGLAALLAGTTALRAQDAATPEAPPTEAPAAEAPATEAPAAEAPAAAAAPAETPANVTADTVVATVNGVDITVGHMIVLRDQLPMQYQSLPDDALFAGILDQLVQQTLLAATVAEPLSRKQTLSLENDRRAYLSGTILEAAVGAAVTEEAVKAAYDAKYAAAEPKTEYSAAHILVATEEEAKAIKAELDAGGDFAEIAKAKSTDGSAAGGGDLGWFGLGMMVKPFETAVVGMKKGDISAPVQTDFGWHIIKLNDTRQAAAPTLDEVRDEIVQEVQRAAVGAKVDELMAGATITRATEGIPPSVLSDDALLDK